MVKYARIVAFSDSNFPLGRDIRFCPYPGKYGPEKTRVLAYFAQRMLLCTEFGYLCYLEKKITKAYYFHEIDNWWNWQTIWSFDFIAIFTFVSFSSFFSFSLLYYVFNHISSKGATFKKSSQNSLRNTIGRFLFESTCTPTVQWLFYRTLLKYPRYENKFILR